MSKEITELLVRKAELQRELAKIGASIASIQASCEHTNRSETRERDAVELRYETYVMCNDCTKSWYE